MKAEELKEESVCLAKGTARQRKNTLASEILAKY